MIFDGGIIPADGMGLAGLPDISRDPSWLDSFPGDPWILGLVGVFLGLFGMPLSPYWVYLGLRLGGIQGFLVGWGAALVAMAIQFPLVRWAGKGLFFRLKNKSSRQNAIWEKLSRLEANAFGLLWARLAWVIPFVVVNTWAAMGRLPFLVFFFISGLSIAPNIAGIVFVGDFVGSWGKDTGVDKVAVFVLVGFGLIGFFVWLARRWMKEPELKMEKPVE